MSFLQPWAMWFLIGVPIIVALYLVRLKRRELTVSTHLFWQRVLQKSSSRALFHRLRNWLSLLLNVLVFALLVAALAKPLFDASSQESANIVLLIDTRARMQALEPDGESRFQKALLHARKYARQANSRRNFALVTVDAGPEVIAPFTDDERLLAEKIDGMSATDAAGDLGTGINLARNLLATRHGRKRLIVVTDRTPIIEDTQDGTEVLVHPVGSSRSNVAITRFAIRKNPGNPQTAELLLRVQNFGTEPASIEAELAYDGRPFELKQLDLAAGEQQTHIFSSVPRPNRASRGWVTTKLNGADSLAVDNQAYALLPPQSPNRVLLVTPGNPFLEKLLAADTARSFQLITLDAWHADLAQKFESIIFDRAIPPGFEWDEAAGRFFFIGVTPFSIPGRPLVRPLITEVDPNHPITRNVSLENVLIQQANAMVLPVASSDWSFATPLRTLEHPLMIIGNRASARMAALGFDVLQSDLPLRVAFPLLIGNTLNWLEDDGVPVPETTIAGETIVFPSVHRVSANPVQDPLKLPAMSEPTRLFTPCRNGYYRVSQADKSHWLAVNTFSETESDLRIPSSTAVSPVPPTALPGRWPAWQWLAMAALALFTSEWWLFHRRKTE